jgi:hypothetical protein
MDNEEDIVATLKSGENLKEKLCSKIISKFSRPPKVKTSAKKQGKEIL